MNAYAQGTLGLALADLQKAAVGLEHVRKNTDSKIIQQILLQMEQRIRLDAAHLGVILGLKSQATVRTSRPSGAKSPKRRRRKPA